MLCGGAIIRGSGLLREEKGMPAYYAGGRRNGSGPTTMVAHRPVLSNEARIGHKGKILGRKMLEQMATNFCEGLNLQIAII
jgi:hypothetical protein